MSATQIAILDYGMGNLRSAQKALEHVGVEVVVTNEHERVRAAAGIVLPGVGAFPRAIDQVRRLGLDELIVERLAAGTPTLGICLGMQLMFEASDEADAPCLGLIPGRVRAMVPRPGRAVPHMGWTRIEDAAPGIALANGDYVYFAHGFACDDGPATAARATYGEPITAAVRQGHLWGAQFHPERSSAPGASFLKAFLES